MLRTALSLIKFFKKNTLSFIFGNHEWNNFSTDYYCNILKAESVFPTQNFHIQYAQSLLQLKRLLLTLTIHAEFMKWKNYTYLWRGTISCVCLRLSQATDCMSLTGLDLEEGSSMLPLKIGNYLPINTLSYSSGLIFISLLWEPQIVQFMF